MKRLFSLALVSAFLLCTGCGGDTHESLTGDQMSTMKELNATLDNVKDEASAKDNLSKLKSLMEKLNGINEKQAKLPMPTEEEFKAIEAKYGKELEDVTMKLTGHKMRVVLDPKIHAQLLALDDIKAPKM